MNFVEAMTAAQSGFDTWAAKPHNAKWAKMVYHTPIPNDLLVNIAEAFCRASPAPVAGVGVKPLEWAEDWSGELDNIPIWRAPTPWGSATISFAGCGYASHADVPVDVLRDKQAAAQSDFNTRILSSIIPATKGGEDTLDILEGIESDLEFLRIAINSGDPHRELRVRVADVTDLVNTLRATLSAQDTDGVAKP